MKMTYVFPMLSIINQKKADTYFFLGGGQKLKSKKNKDNLQLAHPKIYQEVVTNNCWVISTSPEKVWVGANVLVLRNKGSLAQFTKKMYSTTLSLEEDI